MYEKLSKVSDDVELLNKNVCCVSEVCDDLSARPVNAPSGVNQGSPPPPPPPRVSRRTSL